jgi:TDG/mug DNA glycosylase family protein
VAALPLARVAILDTHALDDLLVPGLKVVFCAAAAGTASAAQGAFYANPQNRFWKTLHEVGLTPTQLEPREYRSLTEYGIGLADISKTGVGMDTSITKDQWDVPGLRTRIAANAPRLLAFNGLGPARTAFHNAKIGPGRHSESFEGAEVWVLPSTSPSAGRTWDAEIWQAFAERVRSLDTPAPLPASAPEPEMAPKTEAAPKAKTTPKAKPAPKAKAAPNAKTTSKAKAAPKAKPTPNARPSVEESAAGATTPTPAVKEPPATTGPAEAPAPKATPAPQVTATPAAEPSHAATSAADAKSRSSRRPVVVVAAVATAAAAAFRAIRRRTR